MIVGSILKYVGLLIILGSFGVYLILVSTMPGDPGKDPMSAFLVASVVFCWGLATVLAGMGILKGKPWGHLLAFSLSLVWMLFHAYGIFFRKPSPDVNKLAAMVVFLIEVLLVLYFFQKARLALQKNLLE